MDLGFERQGFRTIFAADINDAAIETFNANFGGARAHKIDLGAVTPRGLIDAVVKACPGVEPRGIIGGPPCQGFSVGNVHSLSSDPRNLLPLQYAKLAGAFVREWGIDFFLFENVVGITTEKHKKRFEEILEAFDSAGFSVFKTILNAADFEVPQLRKRVFLLGLNRNKYPSLDFSFPSGYPMRISLRDTFGNLPEPVFFQRNLDAQSIAVHPNHWTMKPKSAKFNGETDASNRSFRRLSWDEPSPTAAYGNREIHVHPNGKRRLSIYECLLIQGFPKEFILKGTLSQQVTQVSNAVAPPVAAAIAAVIRDTVLTSDKSVVKEHDHASCGS